MKKNLIVLLICLCSGVANAGWSEWGAITILHVNDGSEGKKRVYLKGLSISDPSCSSGTLPVILFDDSPQSLGFGKELLSIATAAFFAKREIRAHATVCWNAWNTPVVTAIEVR